MMYVSVTCYFNCSVYNRSQVQKYFEAFVFHYISEFVFCISYLLNQARAGFLEITLVRTSVCMCVRPPGYEKPLT